MLPRRERLNAAIPTSSMADIAFLLIVFFMMTTVFSSNAGMEHMLPKQDQDNQLITPEAAIHLHVVSKDHFLMDGQTIPMEGVARVYAYVDSRLQVNPNKPIILQTAPDAPYGAMVAVMDQLEMLENHYGHVLDVTFPTKEEVSRY